MTTHNPYDAPDLTRPPRKEPTDMAKTDVVKLDLEQTLYRAHEQLNEELRALRADKRDLQTANANLSTLYEACKADNAALRRGAGAMEDRLNEARDIAAHEAADRDVHVAAVRRLEAQLDEALAHLEALQPKPGERWPQWTCGRGACPRREGQYLVRFPGVGALGQWAIMHFSFVEGWLGGFSRDAEFYWAELPECAELPGCPGATP